MTRGPKASKRRKTSPLTTSIAAAEPLPADAYERRCAKIRDAWKQPQKNPSSLALLIRSDYPIKDIAALMRNLYRPRRRGKPGGAHWRWTLPLQLAAWLVGRLPRAERTDKAIADVIRILNGWAFRRGKRPLDSRPGSRDHERVKTLLRGSRRQRL